MNFNSNLAEVRKLRKLQLIKLKEIHNDAYENSRVYKAKMKVFHDKYS